MKVPQYRIEAAVCAEQARYGLEAVYLDVQKRLLVATDGHQLTVVPCEPDAHDESGIVSPKALRTAREYQRRVPKKLRDMRPVTLRAGRRVVVRSPLSGDVLVTNRPAGKFPQWEKVVTGFSGVPDLVIDVDVLRKAVDALREAEGGDAPKGAVALWIDKTAQPSTSAVLVAPAYGAQNRFALVMGMRNADAQSAERVLAVAQIAAPEALDAKKEGGANG